MPAKKLLKRNKKNASKKTPPKKKKSVEESRSIAEQVVDAGLILGACGNDEEVAQFFMIWLQNGRRADLAYMAINPKVTNKRSASTLGGRMLNRVDRSEVCKAYGIGYDEYFKQLHDGLNATKGRGKPDHKVRRDYHKAAGEILGIEQKSNGGNNAVQVNIGKVVDDWIIKD